MHKLIAPLLLMWLSACSTIEYVPIAPQCTPPPSPALPEISRGQLWDKLGDDQYRELEAYINALWAFSDEQGAMLDALCATSGDDG